MVIWYIFTNSSEERTVSIFRVTRICGIMAARRHVEGTGGKASTLTGKMG